LRIFASKLYFKSAGNLYHEVHPIARKELIEQLDSLKSQTRGLFILFAFVFLLIGIPFVIYDIHLVRLVRAHASLRLVLPLGLGLFAVWLVAALFCIAVLNRFVARRAPACPQCSKHITWRERSAVLASGKCPHCDFRLFRV
jgi:DNA-directed RNA polymerase subunit RPC12/RpoP